MNDQHGQSEIHQAETIDIVELFQILWHRKLIILTITALFAVGSVIYALSLTNIYRSEALLVPSEASQPSNPLIAQLGVAAGLVGINAADNRANQVVTAIATLQSREFLRQFIARHDLKPALFAGEWSQSNQESHFDESVYDSNSMSWVGGEPSDLDAAQLMQGILTVENNRTTGLVTIAIQWKDPSRAKDWVEWLIVDVNDLLKQQDLFEANSAIEYLQSKLQNTQLVEMQRVFYQLIESQTRIVMLADVREDYVFKTVDPAFIPQDRIAPRRSIICVIGTLFGAALAMIAIFILHSLDERKRLLPLS